MLLRPVTVDDAAWIPRLAERLFAPWESDYGTAVARWMGQENTSGWVAVDEELGPVGFVLLSSLGLVGEGRPHVLEVVAIGVAPGARRQGVGRSLLARVVRHARTTRGVLEVRLNVAADNEAGRRLFEQAGFTVTREDDGTFGGGRRALRMSWRPRA